MSTSIALYGDSYVKRLREFCNNDLRVRGTDYWYDKSGLRADLKKRDGQREDTDARAMYNSMLELRPDVAFIIVSGNDITSQTTPREIFDRVVLIVNDLQAAGTSTIFVAEIMTKSPDQYLDKATFDRKRQKINSLLAKRFKDVCWSHLCITTEVYKSLLCRVYHLLTQIKQKNQ